jgi:hypothetical protein
MLRFCLAGLWLFALFDAAMAYLRTVPPLQ